MRSARPLHGHAATYSVFAAGRRSEDRDANVHTPRVYEAWLAWLAWPRAFLVPARSASGCRTPIAEHLLQVRPPRGPDPNGATRVGQAGSQGPKEAEGGHPAAGVALGWPWLGPHSYTLLGVVFFLLLAAAVTVVTLHLPAGCTATDCHRRSAAIATVTATACPAAARPPHSHFPAPSPKLASR